MDKPIQFRDFSRGTIRTVNSSIAVPNSYKLGLNLDSDKEVGSLVSRLGTDIVGKQAVASATCLGLSYFRDTVGTDHILFGAFSDGNHNDIYDMSDGSKSLEDDTAGLKTRFCTFLDSVVRVNGTDVAKSYNGSSWVTTGGVFDEDSMPKGNVVIEWKDRVYTAGVSSSPSILYYSGVADPDARTVSWGTGNGYIEIEQEDGGGAITALEKVPGYLLIFKERTMKRWDGSSTYPEDLVNMGAPTQEAVCRGRGMVFVANQQGLWATDGGRPKKISKPIQDLWDAIPATNLDSIATYCDENYVYAYVGDITLDNTYSNVCFKFNIDSQSFDVYSYYDDFTVFSWYISSSEKVMIAGNKNGEAIQVNTGNTDYYSTVQPITWSLETHDIDFGHPGRVKDVNTMNWYSRNIRLGQVFYRADSDKDSSWESLGNVDGEVAPLEFKARGNRFNFKITGVTDSGQIKIKGFEFPEQSIAISKNVQHG